MNKKNINKLINKLIDEYGISSDKQLINLAKQLKIKVNYIGFAENLPNNINKLDGSYIINLGDNSIGGSHWTCFYIEKNMSFYNDSFAGGPEDIVISWLANNNIKTIIYNDDFQFQEISETLCGIWCILFLYYMTHSKKKNLIERFNEFTKHFVDLDF